MHTHPTISVPAAPAPTVRGAVIGTATAAAATTALFVLSAIGADIEVVTGWAPDGAALRYGEVLVTVVVSVLAGAGLLALLERRSSSALRTWSVVAGVVAVASSVPLWGLDVDAGSRLWLTAMHLATGACAVAAQRHTHAPA